MKVVREGIRALAVFLHILTVLRTLRWDQKSSLRNERSFWTAILIGSVTSHEPLCPTVRWSLVGRVVRAPSEKDCVNKNG